MKKNHGEPIPFVSLKHQHDGLTEEIASAWKRILGATAFVGGPEVEAFESEFARCHDSRHAVAVGSGTAALRLALLALGLRPGDEVITVPNTFIATTEAITQAGGRPVFVDVDPETATLDPSRLERAVTERTKIVLPVHLYGQPAEMDPILEIAAGAGLAVLEDAAQAHGAEYKGRKAGALGDAAAFSFYPSKNLGACGEAGAITTGRAEVASRARRLRDHGQAEKNVHETEGTNARLDALQAAALRIKLPRLQEWNEQRRRIAAIYDAGLRDAGVRIPVQAPGRRHVYHLYVIRHPERDRLRAALGEAGIGTGLHYPVPLHLQPAYAGMGHSAGDFPEAERWAAQGLSLPIFPGLAEEQAERVCRAIRQALGEGSR
jgi:dTDP-4-amino-4,6-dideoxygalactose transaminase